MINKIQNSILEIYIQIKKICDENNIRYFAIGGTCLGAVRHKGFIPWDDDIDIAMPDTDYKRFMAAANDLLPENMGVLVTSQNRHCKLLFNKVHNKNTSFIEKHEENYPDEYKGIFVDIMPFTGVPSGRAKQLMFSLRIIMLSVLNQMRRYEFKACDSMGKKLVWLILKPVNCMVSYDKWFNSFEKFTNKYKFDLSDYTGYTWSRRIYKLIFKRELFDDYVDLPFENTTMRCPKRYDEYLTQQFGDYMKMPPESERLSTHKGLIDNKRPYAYYQRNNKIKRGIF